MAIYFVDYENVGSAGIEGIDLLSADNIVHIFYSIKADTMKMDQVIQLMKVKAAVEFHDVTMRGQKNALDFQLIAMLYFTKKDDDTCYIISKDQGYDAAIVFGRTIGAEQVFRRVSINSENISDTKVPQQPRRSGRRSEPARSSGHMSQQPQPVLLAEKARGVTVIAQGRDMRDAAAAKAQTESRDSGQRDGGKAEPVKREAPKAAEPVKKEEAKPAEPVKQEEAKAAEPVKKEEMKAAEPVKIEETKPAEPVKQEEKKPAEPVKQAETKAAEPVKQAEPVKKEEAKPAAKVWPKPYDPSKDTLKTTGIPSFRREVVVVKTVENAGKEAAAKAEDKPVQTAAKPEENLAEPAQTAAAVKTEDTPAAKLKEEEAYNPLKAAAQWDILQSSFGGLFDLDIPEEFLMDDDVEPSETEKAEKENAEKAAEEAAEDKKEEAKHSRSRSRQSRRRGQRQANAQKAEAEEKPAAEPAAVQAESENKKDLQGKPEKKTEQSAKPEKKAEQPAKTEKKTEQSAKPEKKAEQPSKEEKKAEQPAKPEKKADQKKVKEQKQIDKKTQAQALVRVKEVMQAAGFELEAGDYALITDALLSTSTKNQFYQFFRKSKGEAAGREFYLKIRGQYENLKVLREA